LFNPNSGEPLGLPKGTVRGVIALAFAGTLIQQVVIGAIEPITFIGVAGPFLGYYVATRPNEPAAQEPPLAPPSVAEGPLGKPAIGGGGNA